MKTLSKVLFGAVCLAGLSATAADAQDWGGLTATVAVESDYRFRGISQNDRQPTPEVGVTWNMPMGFYTGVWAAKTNWTGSGLFGNTPSFETDVFGGKHFDLAGTDLNVEAYGYLYPDAKASILGPKAASYFEGIFQLTHSFGPLTIVGTGAVSPEWSLGGGTGGYVSGNAAYALTDWLSVSATVGHQWVDAAPSDYTHWDVGATATYKNFALDARYVDSNIGKANCGFWIGTNVKSCQAGFKAMLTYTINPFPW